MTDSQPPAAPPVASAENPPRFVVLDTNVLLRFLILDFGVKERVDLSYFLMKAGATLVLAHCQEDEFWRNSPDVFSKHVAKWRGVSADVKSAILSLQDGLAAAAKLSLLTSEQLDAAATIRSLKTVIEKVGTAKYAWPEFQHFAEKAIEQIRQAQPADLFDADEVERAAARRIQVGNPPRADGKTRHWGDCVVWETVRRLAARGEGPVWFATMDGDFSATDLTLLHPFLQREIDAVGGTIKLFREAQNLGIEFRTRFCLFEEATRFVPAVEANRMRSFLQGIAGVSPDASWRDVMRALKSLSYREREILKLRLGLGDGYRYTGAEMAYIFKISEARVSQIGVKAERKFFERLLRFTPPPAEQHPAEQHPAEQPAKLDDGSATEHSPV